MITATIGKTFLKAFNKREGTSLNAREFFDQYMFPLFFDHPKYFQWVQNSPFVQGITKQKPWFEPEERQEKLEQLHSKIAEGDRDASIAIGFPASETKEFATTSGLISDLELPMDEEEVYYSWIGGGLGLGVAGGYVILFDQPDILLCTYDGWRVYREFLNDPALKDKIRGNQVITWNGQWLTFRYSKNYRQNFDFNLLQGEEIFSVNEHKIEVNTVPWTRLYFSLSRQFPDSVLTGYVYSLGQTNKTAGFFPFHFQSGRRLYDIYQRLTGEAYQLQSASVFEQLFGLHIKRACELGAIGLQALEPKNLRKYFNDTTNLKLEPPNVKQKSGEKEEDYQKRKEDALKKDQDNLITYFTYKTWLIAMLTKNKEETSEYTQDLAEALHKYRANANKMDRKNRIDNLFSEKSKKGFLNVLTEMVSDAEEDILPKFKDLRDKVHLMSSEDFTYFTTLLKFDYAYQDRITKQF